MPTHTAPRRTTTMAPDDARHGTYAGAAAHHSEKSPLCPHCRDAQRVYMRRRDKLRKMGRPARLPLGDARYQRLLDARQRGLTYQTIADEVGVALTTPYNWLRRGPEVLVPVRMLTLIDRARLAQPVTPVGVLRRLQALTWLGYPAVEISRRLNLSEETIFEALNGNRQQFHDRVRDGIVALFDELWDQPIYNQRGETAQVTGGRVRAHNRAVACGWVAPMAWDCIDDPTERPKVGRRTLFDSRPKTDVDEAIVLRVMAGDKTLAMTTAERREVVKRLRERGVSFLDIEALTGISKVERYLPGPTDRGEAVA